MIFTALLTILFNIFIRFIQLFPLVDEANLISFTDKITGFQTTLHTVSVFFPTTVFWRMITLILLIESSIALFRGGRWIIRNLSAGFLG